MPVWMEILLNVIGYAGFVIIATFHKPLANRRRTARHPSVSLVRLSGRARHPVRLDQDAVSFRLRPQRKADGNEGGAEQQANRHHPPVSRLIRIVE